MTNSLNNTLYFLFSLSLCGENVFVLHIRRNPPSHPPKRHCQLRRGGHTRAIRYNCAISAASAEPTASQFCQFSGFSRASRLSFQREIVTKCKICNKKEELNPLLSNTLY